MTDERVRRPDEGQAERKRSRGRHQHQPGRDDRKPDRRPGAALGCRSGSCGVQPCASRVTRAARTEAPANGRTSPTTSTSRCGGAQGENAARFLSKGRPVAIDGRLEWREWEAQDGTKRQAIDIIADPRCSSWARATTPQAAGGTHRRSASRRRGLQGQRHPGRRRGFPARTGFRRSRRRRHSVLASTARSLCFRE